MGPSLLIIILNSKTALSLKLICQIERQIAHHTDYPADSLTGQQEHNITQCLQKFTPPHAATVYKKLPSIPVPLRARVPWITLKHYFLTCSMTIICSTATSKSNT